MGTLPRTTLIRALPPPSSTAQNNYQQGERMLDPLGPVTIGAREIYDQVLNVGGKVEQVGAKVDGVITEVADHEARLRVVERTDTGDHEARIRALERNRWPLPSLAALVGLAALVIALIPLIKGS